MADRIVASCTSSSSRSVSSLVANARPPVCHHHEPSTSFSVASCPSSSSPTTIRFLRGRPLFITGAALPQRSGQTSRVVCLFGGEKRDAARRALESALGEKKEVFSKWDEEIKKREASGGGGSGGSKDRGRGWGGGGGGGGDKSGGDDSSSEGSESGPQWGEALQVVYAFAGLTGLYLVLTQGSRMLALLLNSLLFISRGLKPLPKPRYAPVNNQQAGNAESHVRSKWGSDD